MVQVGLYVNRGHSSNRVFTFAPSAWKTVYATTDIWKPQCIDICRSISSGCFCSHRLGLGNFHLCSSQLSACIYTHQWKVRSNSPHPTSRLQAFCKQQMQKMASWEGCVVHWKVPVDLSGHKGLNFLRRGLWIVDWRNYKPGLFSLPSTFCETTYNLQCILP